jgi:hypothetical protein
MPPWTNKSKARGKKRYRTITRKIKKRNRCQ